MVLMLIVSTSALASEEGIVELRPGADVGDVARLVLIAEDESRDWNLEDAIGTGAFRPNLHDIVNPGVSGATIWLKLVLRNSGDRAGTWIFTTDRVLVAVGEIFLERSGSTEHLLENSPVSFQQSYREFGALAARIQLAAGETAVLYLRYRGANWSGLEPLLLSEASFEDRQAYQFAVFLLLFGGVVTLVLYATISFALLGRGIIFFYALAQLSFFAFFAHMAGLTTIYLWPDNPEFGRIFSPLTVAVFVGSMAQFARLFFDTAANASRVDRILKLAVMLAFAGMALSPLDFWVSGFDRRIALYAIYLAAIISWLTLPLLAFFATFRWERNYWPIAIAWTVMSSYMITLMLVLLGVVDTIPMGEQSYAIVYFEALFLALAIALRVRTLREENLRSQQALNESLTAQLEESQRAMRLAEERQWALQDLAEKGRLLLAAGHDARQSVGALRSFAAGLRDEVSMAQNLRVAGELEAVAEHLNNTLTTTMHGSRSGGIADTVLALQLQTATSILSPLKLIHEDAASERNIQLRIRESPAAVVCDAVLVLRVLSNLVSNAIKYANVGGRVLVGCRTQGRALRFQVWDSGPGITEADLEVLMTAPEQAHRLGSTVAGTGVGLGIAAQLAMRMGGSLLAQSWPDRGSLFELVIPIVGIRQMRVPAVLVLESEKHQLDQIARLVANVRLPVSLLTTMDELSAHQQQLPEAAVIIDQHFTGRDGARRAVERIREQGGAAGIAVMTFDQSASARAQLAEFCDLIVYKPLSAVLLITALVRLSEVSSQGSEMD